jgi:hypothetical protein
MSFDCKITTEYKIYPYAEGIRSSIVYDFHEPSSEPFYLMYASKLYGHEQAHIGAWRKRVTEVVAKYKEDTEKCYEGDGCDFWRVWTQLLIESELDRHASKEHAHGNSSGTGDRTYGTPAKNAYPAPLGRPEFGWQWDYYARLLGYSTSP